MSTSHDYRKSKEHFTVAGYLYTPPENTADSFSNQDESQEAAVSWKPTVLPHIVQTPPASPEFRTVASIAGANEYLAHDALLYPEHNSPHRDRAQSQLPLFEKERTLSASPVCRAVNHHSPAVSTVQSISTPAQGRPFPECLNIRTGQDALRYYSARMEELRRAQGFRLPQPERSPSACLDPESSRQLQRLTRTAGVTKERVASKTVVKPKADTATSPARTSPPKRRTPKARTYDDFVDSAFPTKESAAKHKRAPPTKKVESENVSWAELPDYAPPSNDLDHNRKTLKVTWHGHALSLAADPDSSHLHEQELQVASTLRLTCAVYLTNKRKIFQARLQALKEGKNFTKTAAQSACKIDVNKASQLWEAFDKVGWFDAERFAQYL